MECDAEGKWFRAVIRDGEGKGLGISASDVTHFYFYCIKYYTACRCYRFVCNDDEMLIEIFLIALRTEITV